MGFRDRVQTVLTGEQDASFHRVVAPVDEKVHAVLHAEMPGLRHRVLAASMPPQKTQELRLHDYLFEIHVEEDERQAGDGVRRISRKNTRDLDSSSSDESDGGIVER